MRGSQFPTILVLLSRKNISRQASLVSRRMASSASQGRGYRNQQWRGRPNQGPRMSSRDSDFAPRSNRGGLVQGPRMNFREDDAAFRPSRGGLAQGSGERDYSSSTFNYDRPFKNSGASATSELASDAHGQRTKWLPRANDYHTAGISTTAEELESDEQVHRNLPVFRPSKTMVKARGAWAQAQLRAIFYPKFENEKSDQEIRMKMIEVVDAGKGILEVSLKHSGSLFMYSGDHGGAFAKNSFGNLYTAVGVFVLGRTLQEAWGSQAAEKQREFNAFLEKNHICISMELVTAVLGDHGQRPLQDYVVVTAVADLDGKPRFYAAPDLIAFCRRWRLPTNHVWLFSSRKSATTFFSAYDALCEEGTATPVSKVLDEVADISVPAVKSHMQQQGEILEGLVARIVSPKSVERLQKVLQQYPIVMAEGHPTLGPSLREICAANKTSQQQQIKALLKSVGKDMCSDWSDWGRDGAGQSSASSLFNKFLLAEPVDEMSRKLKEMIKVLRDLRMQARFPCRPCPNSTDTGKIHFKMIIHILQDSVFRRYQKEMRKNPSLWPLFRGFFVDIYLFDDRGEVLKKPATSETDVLAERLERELRLQNIEDDKLADDAEHLMLKLKFLTYKIRTFLIRNGLATLFHDGFGAYRQYYFRQMEFWGTSLEKRHELDQLLTEWAGYITRICKGRQPNDRMYLSYAEPFLEQYAKRNAKNQRLIGSAGSIVKTEDFLANVDTEFNDYQEPVTPSIKPYTTSSEEPSKEDDSHMSLKAKGVLVFFPGIPGCAKSALCRELLNTPGGFGDSRPVHSLVGDLMKGRYWPQLAEERRKHPYAITLADKNAPNEEVWKQIEETCRNTHAIGVPVVPDSEGTKSNPFSLDALAVFIYRVLQRVNHPGNLDKDSPNPGYVLLLFYNLYEGKDRKEFEEDLRRRFGHIVKMPLLKPNRPPMRPPVTAILIEGLQLYQRHTAKHNKLESTKGIYKGEWETWERRLKEIIFANADYLNSIQIPFEEVVLSVRKQLEAIAKGENSLHTPVEDGRPFRTIMFAAISLAPNEIIDLLNRVSQSNEIVRSFISGKSLETRLKAVHVTLAHKRSHGVTAVASFGGLRGLKVPVQLTALLFSEKLCALEAHICQANGQEIASYNEWPHVTVWTADGIPPKEANTLPQLVSRGQARRFEFSTPVTVMGVVSLH